MKLFVKNLTNVDFSYLDSQRGMVGESWLAQLELDGSLNSQGMICDFGLVKSRVRDWLDTFVDHRLVVPMHSPQVTMQDDETNLQLTWKYLDGKALICNAPAQAFTQVSSLSITLESLANWCESQLLALFGDEIEGLKLSFIPESISGAFYHYTHGLAQHQGNCQRIAHGHRSRIEIIIDGNRDTALEELWAEQWQDIYLGTTSHLVAREQGYSSYQYSAPQGDFRIKLPSERCDDLDSETTVEQIAQHIVKVLKQRFPQRHVEVRAYEGIGKGAIAQA
ncbi:MAG: 6-carboxytetrahydropterin synthase [Oceanospirillaceae bacterium]|nr:6-carboxytetrahydropterin synthase [Oceanospirillaceae bacterium]